MIITIKRATEEGIKECTGELFEHEGYQYCIGWVEGSLQAIELSTGGSAAKDLDSVFIDEDDSMEEYKANVQSIVRSRSRLMDKAVIKMIEILKGFNIPYPLNNKVVL